MDDNEFRITGRITIAENGAGILGILIRLSDEKRLFDAHSGSVITARDGTFALHYRRSQAPALFEGKPLFRVQVFDRDGRLLQTLQNMHRFEPGKSVNVQISLPAVALRRHHSRPLELQRATGRLLPRDRLASIPLSLTLLSQLGKVRYAELLAVSACALPPIDRFENLLDDIWGTLLGDLSAQRRLEDTLDLVAVDVIERQGGREPPVPDPFSAARELGEPVPVHKHAYGDAPDPRVRVVLDKLIAELVQAAKTLAPVEALLGRDMLLPFMMASAWVAGSEPKRLDRFLRIAVGQIAAYRPLSILLNAAEDARGGGERQLAYLESVLQMIGGWCNPEVGWFPPPFEGVPDFNIPDPARLEHWGCTAEAAVAIREIHDRLGFPPAPLDGGPTYAIDSISPELTCVGSEIVIRGTGFTSTPGIVRFTGGRRRRGEPVDVSAMRDKTGEPLWSDTEIAVVVPTDAACGPVHLRIRERTVIVSACDRFLDFSSYRSAERPAFYMGCAPRILVFELEGGGDCAVHGSAAHLIWTVEPDDANVVLQEHESDTPREIFNGPGPGGSLALDTTRTRSTSFSITVRNTHSTCAAAMARIDITVGEPVPTLSIVGVELTQGIQRFSLADLTSAENNSVELIANMDTVVRVYVSSNRGEDVPANARITGWLTCHGKVYRPINGIPRGSTPIINAKRAPRRSRIDDSLNFLIPAAEAHDEDDISIQVVTADPCDGVVRVGTSMPISWNVRDPLPVTIRRLADPGTGSVVSEEEAMRLVNEAFDRLPSPRTEIRLRPGVFSITPGTAEANYCREGGMYQLALVVAYEHNGVEGLWPDPHESVWVGLFAQSGCSPGGMLSWPWTSTCVSQLVTSSIAHEIAHCVGVGHTVTSAGEQCNNVVAPVACHVLPNDGVLTDVVFDIRNNAVIPGAADLMSYRVELVRYPHPDHWELIRSGMNGRF